MKGQEERLGARVAELLGIAMGTPSKQTMPLWAIECLEIAVSDFISPAAPSVRSPAFQYFLGGFLLAILTNSEKVPSILKLPSGMDKFIAGGFDPSDYDLEYRKLRTMENQPIKLLLQACFPDVPGWLLDGNAKQRRAFSLGLTRGYELTGVKSLPARSTRANANLALLLWFAWPTFEALNSVPEVHRTLEKAFRRTKYSQVTTAESFKKFAQCIGLSQHLGERRRRRVREKKQPLISP